MTTDRDEYYRDILEGMAIYTGSALQRDILDTVTRHHAPALGEALNKNQIACKMWLADALFATVGPRLDSVLVLGGWYGVLGAVLLHDRRFAIGRVVSLDIDPGCAEVAESVNATHVRTGQFVARTGDMLDHVYDAPSRAAGAPPYVVVNTSCEHLADFGAWYDRVPDGQLLVLQSNDYYACGEHVNCVPDLAAFRAQAPMRETLYAGERTLRRYVRFMLIGRK